MPEQKMLRTDTVETPFARFFNFAVFSLVEVLQVNENGPLRFVPSRYYSLFQDLLLAQNGISLPRAFNGNHFSTETNQWERTKNTVLVKALCCRPQPQKLLYRIMSTLPTDEQLREKIKELLPTVDLRICGINKFIKKLSKKLGGVNLKPRSAFIKEELTQAINAMPDIKEESGQESDEEEEDVTPKKKKSGGGLAAPKEISDDLAAFLGQGKIMSRTEIVKMLWAYVREHDLQDPENKQQILLDSALKKVFGCKQFSMFTMNKYISAHVHPFKPVDLTVNTTPKKRKTPLRKSSEKKKRKTGTQPPYRLSEAMVSVLGKEILPRPQVVSGLWEYIKANDLQNPADKREIICDDKLKAIFSGRKKVRTSWSW
jgi:upstream activation factor subunit UAF30